MRAVVLHVDSPGGSALADLGVVETCGLFCQQLLVTQSVRQLSAFAVTDDDNPAHRRRVADHLLKHLDERVVDEDDRVLGVIVNLAARHSVMDWKNHAEIMRQLFVKPHNKKFRFDTRRGD